MDMQEGTLTGVGGVPVYYRRYGQGRRALIVPNAWMFMVPDAGRLAWLEQPEMFFGWLNDFLGDAELNHWSWPAPEAPDGVVQRK